MVLTKPDVYPLPLIGDLFASLSGGKIFSKLYVTHSNRYLWRLQKVHNIMKGLFQFKHLPFGISLAHAIFQWMMESLFTGLTESHCILIIGCNLGSQTFLLA